MISKDAQIRTIETLSRWICFRIKSCDQTGCNKNSASCADCPINNQTNITVPIQASDCGQYAHSNDPSTWATYDEALIYHHRSDTDTDGVAFMLSESAIAIILDECRNPETGNIDDWAESIVGQADTYTEVSHNGTSLRLFVTNLTDNSLDKLRKNIPEPSESLGSHDSAQMEIYEEGYLIPTGDQISGSQDDVQA